MPGFPLRKEFPFPGTDEELDRWLEEHARRFGGRFIKKGDRRFVSQGDLFSTHPSAVAWRAEIIREETSLCLTANAPGTPWARRRMRRLVEARVEQLADYLQTRLRGESGSACATPAQINPFQPLGPGVRGWCLALAGWSLQSCSALILCLLVSLLPGWILISQSRERIEARTEVASRLGALPLPSSEELSSRTMRDDLSAAFLLVFPIVFLITLFLSMAHVLNDLTRLLSRLPLLVLLFFSLLTLFSFWKPLPFWGAVPFALLIPAAAQAGVTLVWSFRRERRRDPASAKGSLFSPSRKMALLAMSLLGVILVATLALHPSSENSLVGIRDRYLFSGSTGRTIVNFYYRHTLYAADAIKPIHPEHEIGAIRTLLFVGSEAPPLPSAWVIDQADPKEACFRLKRYRYDLHVVPETPALLKAIARQGALARTLFREESRPVSQEEFEGLAVSAFDGNLLGGLSHLGWQAVRTTSVPAALFFACGFLALPVGLLLRKLPARAPLLLVPVVFGGSLVGLFLALPKISPEERTLLKQFAGPDDTAVDAALKGTTHPSPLIRRKSLARLLKKPKSVSQRPVPFLKFPAGEKDPLIRARTCTLLGHFSDSRAVPMLQAALEDPSWFVRYHAARALRRPDATPARPRLEELVKTDCWYVGACALSAIRRLQPDQP